MLHKEMLRGDPAALGLACFIGIYWTARFLVDTLYFSHADWPKGKAFVVRHTPDPPVSCACRKLPRAVYLARVAATE